ncbi:MAG: hypothetical protein ACLFTK_17360, partial [Anaerolineales bacterium]
VGADTPDGWVAYAHPGGLFVKTFEHQPGATYPDFGVNVEIFTNPRMLEVESLGPLVTLAPGAAVEHVETWHIFAPVPLPQHDDDVTQHIMPAVRSVLKP